MSDSVLLITTDRGLVKKVTAACDELAAALTRVKSLKDAEPRLAADVPDLILCDYATFENLRNVCPRACVLLYAEPTDSEQAIEAIKRGAVDFLVTPVDTPMLVRHIREALRISRDIRVPATYEEPREDAAVEQIIGQSPAMREVYKLIGLIAPRDVNVLITGESGTGKELIARAILHHSPRRDRPFLAVNCAAIPETLLESELFGHEKGSFTGATVRRIGKFEQCDGGTLFLDEIGDIPLATQAKLLRVLQDNTFQRVGGTELIMCDVRTISATHQPLETMIAENRFRQDLYYRLKVATVTVPPLREREVDVVLLAHKFVRRYNQMMDTDIRTFSPDVLPALLRYPWPGNVRELENAIKAALVVARGTVMRLEFLPDHIRQGLGEDRASPTPGPGDMALVEARAVADKLTAQSPLDGRLYEVATELIEREIIRACLERSGGRLSQAARLLGISRTTLRKKITRHRIRTTTSVDIDDQD